MEMAFKVLGAISNCPRGIEASLEVLLLSSKEKKLRGANQWEIQTVLFHPTWVRVFFFLFF